MYRFNFSVVQTDDNLIIWHMVSGHSVASSFSFLMAVVYLTVHVMNGSMCYCDDSFTDSLRKKGVPLTMLVIITACLPEYRYGHCHRFVYMGIS
jgi:hypothetical protein